MTPLRTIAMVFACALAPAPTQAQWAPQPAAASTPTTNTASPTPTPTTLPAPVERALARYASVQAIIVTLETNSNQEGQPARIELALDRNRRYAQRTILRDASGQWNEKDAYFTHFDGEKFRARRGTLPMYIQHDAQFAWSPAPGPTIVALAPWAVLHVLDGIAQATVSDVDGGSLLRSPQHDTTLQFNNAGTLTQWRTSDDRRASRGLVTYSGFAPVQASADAALPPMPRTIIESPDPNTTSQTPPTPITWTVSSIEVNPSAQRLEQALDFASFGGSFQRFDPDTGDITNPDGTSGGREIQPAARAIDMWEANKKTSAWSAVFKWGSIATGLFLLAGLMELIRRRL